MPYRCARVMSFLTTYITNSKNHYYFRGKKNWSKTYLQEIATHWTGHQHGNDNSKRKECTIRQKAKYMTSWHHFGFLLSQNISKPIYTKQWKSRSKSVPAPVDYSASWGAPGKGLSNQTFIDTPQLNTNKWLQRQLGFAPKLLSYCIFCLKITLNFCFSFGVTLYSGLISDKLGGWEKSYNVLGIKPG